LHVQIWQYTEMLQKSDIVFGSETRCCVVVYGNEKGGFYCVIWQWIFVLGNIHKEML